VLYWISLAVASWIGVYFSVEIFITQYQWAPQAFLLLINTIFYATVGLICLPCEIVPLFHWGVQKGKAESRSWAGEKTPVESGQITRDEGSYSLRQLK